MGTKLHKEGRTVCQKRVLEARLARAPLIPS